MKTIKYIILILLFACSAAISNGIPESAIGIWNDGIMSNIDTGVATNYASRDRRLDVDGLTGTYTYSIWTKLNVGEYWMSDLESPKDTAYRTPYAIPYVPTVGSTTIERIWSHPYLTLLEFKIPGLS